jgi:RNA polymerase sigma-70 factor (ECF subfamily)
LRNTFLTSRTGLKAAATSVDIDEAADELAMTDTPESIFIDQSQQQILQEAIRALPLHYREVVLLCDVEEMSYKEISETLAVPVGTVMSRLARARRQLRQTLGAKQVRRGD